MFDRGVIANVRNFFSANLFLFWFPTVTVTDNDGSSFPHNPPCTFEDI